VGYQALLSKDGWGDEFAQRHVTRLEPLGRCASGAYTATTQSRVFLERRLRRRAGVGVDTSTISVGSLPTPGLVTFDGGHQNLGPSRHCGLPVANEKYPFTQLVRSHDLVSRRRGDSLELQRQHPQVSVRYFTRREQLGGAQESPHILCLSILLGVVTRDSFRKGFRH
jgi:hypothetical protein